MSTPFLHVSPLQGVDLPRLFLTLVSGSDERRDGKTGLVYERWGDDAEVGGVPPRSTKGKIWVPDVTRGTPRGQKGSRDSPVRTVS